MKIKSFGLVLMVAIMAVVLSGCGCFYQQMKGETPAPAAPGAKAVAPDAKTAMPVTPAVPAAVALKDINFDFDKYNVRANDAEILKKNYEWMMANSGKKVKIEGNCDERGTVEYNLVLGQKRADAAKNFLVNLGADGKTIGTVSYGKEKPLCTEHNEGCWTKNRRAHFVPAQ